MIFKNNLLFDLKTLKKFDKKSMYEIYDKWPELAQKAYELEYEIIQFKNIKQIQ